MKFDFKTFSNLMNAPHYEGCEGYLIDDNKEQIPYHVYLCIIESNEVCALICKKMPVESSDYEIYEFNGNKLMAHHIVRVKELDSASNKYQKLLNQFLNKEFTFSK